ncbi:MAG TPA: crossover junction endodeoxyribonuclease RuvC [Vicinamibacterales bacterium]|nr:crossover junction endodeoxyribonuclease RuvC [Vicinamibacterales bacterium]
MSRLFFGFDPSLSHFGYAVANVLTYGAKPIWLAAGVIVTKPLGCESKTEDNRHRFQGLARQLRELVRRHGHPDVVAVEAVALMHGRTTLTTISALGRARGLVDALAAEYSVDAREFHPQALKKLIAGDRTAEKVAVEKSLVARYPELEALFAQLALANREHAADACAAVHAALTTTQHPHQEQ